MNKKQGLGRGLDALLSNSAIPSSAEQDSAFAASSLTIEVPIHQVDPNPNQPRKHFDADQLNDLADSIRHSGIIQPLIVQKINGRYQVIAGERRLRAAKIAELETVPVLIRDVDEQTLLEISLIENLQRSDLNPMEEAEGIQLLMLDYHLTQEAVAKSLGKSRSAIANAVRLLSLPSDVQEYLRTFAISSGHARCLVALNDPELQRAIAHEIIQKQLSVRETEALCKQIQQPEKEKKQRSMLPELQFAQDTLQNRLATKVQINGNQKRGKIVIDYYSPEQLNQLYDWLNHEE